MSLLGAETLRGWRAVIDLGASVLSLEINGEKLQMPIEWQDGLPTVIFPEILPTTQTIPVSDSSDIKQ